LLNGGGEFVRPSQEIYSSDAWYPGRIGELMYISSSKSKPLAYVRIFPLQYLPAENRVVYYQQVSVEVTVSVQPAMAPLPLSPGLRVDYLIITRPIFLGTLENFVAWKQSKGLIVAVETVDNIVNTFSGRDIPEKIRNCINQYYTDNKIKWVLLVGDADNDDGPLVGGMPSYSLDKDWEVPTRYVWNKDPSDEGGWISMDPDWTPTDYYYAGLDGDWDQDADNYFGENAQRNANGVDEADWFAEVYVGRIPIRTTSELSAILAKIINFKESSIPSRNFLLYGAEMGPDWENGRNKKFKEDLKENYLPASLNFHSRYEIDGNLSFNDVNSDINSYNPPFINSASHGSQLGLTLYDNGWYTYFESKSTKNNLTNSGFLQYAWACLSAAFDEVKTQGGYYYGDVLGEDLLKASNCGAIAYIGCTRVGWAYVIYQPPGGYGLMDGQDILFWKNFFNGDDNYRYRPGYALYESKRNYIQEYSPNLNLEIERKVLFSTMLLGDPELLIDAIPPAAPTLVWPENNENIGSNTPNLDWNPVSDPSKPVLYKVFIDDDPNFSSVDRESPWIADDNWLVSLPLEIKTWYWRVCAEDNAGNLSDNSATRSFTVRPLGRPLLCSPKDKARTSSAPTFKWICGAGADNHRLLVDNDADFSSPRENVLLGPTDNTYSVSPENPLPEDNYWWKVIAINPAGESESEVWTFEAVSIFYRIQIDNDPDFSSPRYDDLTYDNWLYLPSENALDDGIWYWRVRTEDVDGNASTWTESFKFTVDTQAPPALSLLSPGDYTYDNNATQTFRWEEYQDPAGFENYIIQIARNPEFTDVYHENTVTENSYTHTFTEDNLFYWRVRAVDKAGNKGAWSDSWCLVVDTTPPSAPRLVSPENNSYLATGTPTFDWDPVADLSGVTYILEIDNENTFTNPLRISGIMVSQYTLTVENALADNTYYWRVQARDKSGNFGQWSEIFKFVVDTVVAKPTLLRPENNSLTNENKPLFRWSAVTDAGVAYRLRIDNDPDCLSPVYDTGFSLVDNFDNFADHPENALADGIWYWQVTARDAAGNENSSGIFRFLIDTEVSRTVLYSPADNAFLNDNTPFFDWQTIIDRSGVTYTLIIDNDPDLSSPIYCKLGLTYSDHTCENELPDGTYYWAVRVEDGAGNQSLSEKRRFVIDTAAPLTPENLQPPDGHLSNTNLPSFGWSEVENADYYELQLARDRAFTQQLRTERCYENFHRPSQPLEEGIWYWRVRALDNAGNSSGWSENRKLVVDTRVLSPRLLSPASGSYLN
ncbi:MAG: C25 family cysteine peptidase, partial [Candidatus Hadarchaeales archaeon]